MRFALVVVLVAVGMAGQALADKDYDALWEQWKQDFGKDFDSEEEEREGFENFIQHDNEIDLRNRLYELGQSEWKAGHNAHSHLSHEDLKSRNGHNLITPNVTTARRDLQGPWAFGDNMPTFYVYTAPSSLKITDKSYKTTLSEPVQDQGQCGCCYSFAGGSVMASYYEKFKSQKIIVSKQEIVDCSGPEGNGGCNGGNAGLVLEYIILNGIGSTSQYPFILYDDASEITTQSCQSQLATYKIDTSKYNMFAINADPLSMKNALKKCGALAVSLFAEDDLNYYQSGIFSCSSDGDNDHAVTLVGWGTSSDGSSYWIIKNSWSTYWGDKGFFKLRFGSCGVDSSSQSDVWGICPNTLK